MKIPSGTCVDRRKGNKCFFRAVHLSSQLGNLLEYHVSLIPSRMLRGLMKSQDCGWVCCTPSRHPRVGCMVYGALILLVRSEVLSVYKHNETIQGPWRASDLARCIAILQKLSKAVEERSGKRERMYFQVRGWFQSHFSSGLDIRHCDLPDNPASQTSFLCPPMCSLESPSSDRR